MLTESMKKIETFYVKLKAFIFRLKFRRYLWKKSCLGHRAIYITEQKNTHDLSAFFTLGVQKKVNNSLKPFVFARTAKPLFLSTLSILWLFLS